MADINLPDGTNRLLIFNSFFRIIFYAYFQMIAISLLSKLTDPIFKNRFQKANMNQQENKSASSENLSGSLFIR